MPIRDDLKQYYGPAWEKFSNRIKFVRAKGRCECTGECLGRHRGRCRRRHGYRISGKRRKTILTTAHLCNCSPPCQIARHVKAMCQRCHLRLDSKSHRASARRTRDRKTGQRSLFEF